MIAQRAFLSSQKVSLCPFIASLLPSLLLGNHPFTFCHYSFAFSRILCKWNHTVYSLLDQASFTLHSAFAIRSCCVSLVCPFCSWGIMCCIPTPHFVYPFTSIHRYLFPGFGLKAATNIWVHFSLWTCFYFSWLGLLDRMVNMYLTLKKIC